MIVTLDQYMNKNTRARLWVHVVEVDAREAGGVGADGVLHVGKLGGVEAISKSYSGGICSSTFDPFEKTAQESTASSLHPLVQKVLFEIDLY